MNKRIFACMIFLAVFVAAIGTVPAEEAAMVAESDKSEAEPAEKVPVLYLFVADPEGELSFDGTIEADDTINLKVSAYDAEGDVHLVSVRSTREGCNQTETNLGNFSGGQFQELDGPWDENCYVFIWAWTEHEDEVVVSSVCSVYVKDNQAEA